MSAWDANDPTFGRPLAAPLEQCAQLLDVDLATLRAVAADVEPYLRHDAAKTVAAFSARLRDHIDPRHRCHRTGGGGQSDHGTDDGHPMVPSTVEHTQRPSTS